MWKRSRSASEVLARVADRLKARYVVATERGIRVRV